MNYWKVKAAVLEFNNTELQAQSLLVQAQIKLNKALTEVGLKLDIKYEMNDETETITESK